MYQTLETQTDNGIHLITINRPDKLNALNKDVIEELGNALDRAEKDDAVKIIILTGKGEKSFVAGADITEFTNLDAAGGAALAQKGQQKVFDRLENLSKPTIAAVNGFALGGGCELAMACHFRTAAENARFGQPEVNLGLIPGYGGTQRLTQLIGKGKAMELMMTADMIDANQALQLGLVNHVFSPMTLIEETKKIAEKIMSKSPMAIRAIIACVNEAAKADAKGFDKEIERFGQCFGTEDMREGTTAFLEKRKAVFTGN